MERERQEAYIAFAPMVGYIPATCRNSRDQAEQAAKELDLKGCRIELVYIEDHYKRVNERCKLANLERQNAELQQRIKDQRAKIESTMPCVECGGLFEVSKLNPSSADPEAAPICDACIEVEAIQQKLDAAEKRAEKLVSQLAADWELLTQLSQDQSAPISDYMTEIDSRRLESTAGKELLDELQRYRWLCERLESLPYSYTSPGPWRWAQIILGPKSRLTLETQGERPKSIDEAVKIAMESNHGN